MLLVNPLLSSPASINFLGRYPQQRHSSPATKSRERGSRGLLAHGLLIQGLIQNLQAISITNNNKTSNYRVIGLAQIQNKTPSFFLVFFFSLDFSRLDPLTPFNLT
jgi:hypothetical protein